MTASLPDRRFYAEEEFVDVQELASEAADSLEAYQRAPWRQLTEEARMAALRRAISLLHRIEELETGQTPIWANCW